MLGVILEGLRDRAAARSRRLALTSASSPTREGLEMSRPRPLVALGGASVLLLLGTPAAGLAAADSVFQPRATVLKPDTEMRGRIRAPGAGAWYAMTGPSSLNHSVIYAGAWDLDSPVDEPPSTCPGRTPLLVSLYSPEGAWMRNLRAPAEFGSSAKARGPALPGRYLLHVRAANRRCAGLRFTLSHARVPKVSPPMGGTSSPVSEAEQCRFDQDILRVAESAVREHTRRVRGARGRKRERYLRVLRAAERTRARARATERSSCS